MKISVGKFQDLYKASIVEMEDIDKAIVLVKILTGKSDFEVNQMKVSKFNQLCAEIRKVFDKLDSDLMKDKPKKFVWVGRRLYRLDYDIKRMTSAQYIEATTFSQDLIGNLHKMLATMAIPCKMTWRGIRAKNFNQKNHAQIAEDMLNVDFSVGYHACVFFYAVLLISIKSLSTSGSKLEQQIVDQSIKHLTRLSDGFIMPNWLQTSSALN
jgi:hypothetical protein